MYEPPYSFSGAHTPDCDDPVKIWSGRGQEVASYRISPAELPKHVTDSDKEEE